MFACPHQVKEGIMWTVSAHAVIQMADGDIMVRGGLPLLLQLRHQCLAGEAPLAWSKDQPGTSKHLASPKRRRQCHKRGLTLLSQLRHHRRTGEASLACSPSGAAPC